MSTSSSRYRTSSSRYRASNTRGRTPNSRVEERLYFYLSWLKYSVTIILDTSVESTPTSEWFMPWLAKVYVKNKTERCNGKAPVHLLTVMRLFSCCALLPQQTLGRADCLPKRWSLQLRPCWRHSFWEKHLTWSLSVGGQRTLVVDSAERFSKPFSRWTLDDLQVQLNLSVSLDLGEFSLEKKLSNFL